MIITGFPLNQKPTIEELTGFLALIKEKRDRQKIKAYTKKYVKWKWKDLNLLELFEVSRFKQPLKPKVSESSFLSEDEIKRLISASDNVMWESFIILLYQTGARPLTLQQLKWKDIKFGAESSDINLYAQKNGESRIFPVTEATKFLRKWKHSYSFPNVKADDFVFPSKKNRDKPIAINTFNFALKKFGKKAGIEKDIWTYLMRHMKATQLYNNLPTQTVEKLMGHKGMSKFYHHLSSEKAKEEVLSKLYKIEEMSEQTRTQLEERIKKLEEQQKEVKKKVRLEVQELRKVLNNHFKKKGVEI